MKKILLVILSLALSANVYASGMSGGSGGGGSFSGTLNDLFPGTDDKVIVHNGTDWQTKAVADCDAAGGVLNYDTTTNAFSCHTLTNADVPATATATQDSILVGNGTTVWQNKVLPDCDSTNNALNYDVTTNTFTCASISNPLDTSATFTWTGPHSWDGVLVSLLNDAYLHSDDTTGPASPAAGDIWYDVSGEWKGKFGDATTEYFLHSSGADDTVLVGAGTSLVEKTIPNCVSTDFLQYSQSTNTFACGTPSGGGGGNHNILSTDHPDTVGAGSEARGDLLYRNSGGKWTSLPVGSSNQVLHGGSDPGYSAITDADVPNTITISGTDTVSLASLIGSTDDSLLVNSGSVWAEKVLPSCSSSGEALNYNSTTNAFSCRSISAGSCAVHNILDGATHGDTVAHTVVFGDILYGNSTPAWQALAGNTTSTKKFLTQAGNGSVSATPAWSTIIDSDVPNDITISGTDVVSLTAIAGSTDDTVATGNGTDWQAKAVPDCDDSSGNHLNYDTATNAWSCGTSASSSGSSISLVHLWDDFMGDQASNSLGWGNTNWSASVSGSGASTQVGTQTAGHPGIMECDTGTSGTGRCGFRRGSGTNTLITVGGGTITWESLIMLSDLEASGTQEYAAYIGFGDGMSGEFANGVYFRYSTADTHWQTVYALSSSRSVGTTSVTVAEDVWIKLKIVIAADGSSATFFINGSSVTAPADATKMPTGGITPTFDMIQSVGASPRTIDIDYASLDIALTTPR